MPRKKLSEIAKAAKQVDETLRRLRARSKQKPRDDKPDLWEVIDGQDQEIVSPRGYSPSEEFAEMEQAEEPTQTGEHLNESNA